MQKLAEVCIRRPVFAAMIVLALVVVGAASLVPPRRRPLPVGRPAHGDVRTELPGASPEEVETRSAQKLEEASTRSQGIQELRSISGPGNVDRHRRPSSSTATSTWPPRTCATRSPSPSATCRATSEPPIISKFDNDQAPVLTIALSGDRSLRELTELADKIVKVAARALDRRRRGADRRRARSARSTSGSTPTAWPPTSIPITAVRDALVAPERRRARRQRDRRAAARPSLRTLGRVADPRAFDDLVVATVNGAPVRVRDIGYAEDGTKEQRSAGAPQRRADA